MSNDNNPAPEAPVATVTPGSDSSEASLPFSDMLRDMAITGDANAADALVGLKEITFQDDSYHSMDGNTYTVTPSGNSSVKSE